MLGRGSLPAVENRQAWEELVERFKTDAAIAAEFGVTRQAVNKRRRAALETPPPVRGETEASSLRPWIPWTIAVRHTNSLLYRCLVAYAREQSGGVLTARQQTELAKFKDFMADAYDETGAQFGPAVLVYHRDTPDGLYWEPVRPGEDPDELGYVRRPEGDASSAA